MTQSRERVAEFRNELREGSEPSPSDRSIKEIVDALMPQLQELASKHAELARTELAPVGRKAGIAAGLLFAGAVFLLVFLMFFFLTGMYIMISMGFPEWAAAGIITGILLIIGGILAGSGAGKLRTLDPKPHHTIRALQQNIEWIKGQFRQ